MTPVERFARLREILLTLPALSDREERESYLDEICGDDLALRQEALSLFGRNPDEELPSVARTGGLAQRVGFVAADLPMPDSIGPYAVLGVLGRGGMGIVYRGEQREPLQREVAIKLVHIGLDRERVLSRFRAERQALALMEHPSIARVFDAGEDQEGRPYFVMELVRGVPVTEFVRDHEVPLERRLSLFCEICRAIEHAHRKGIIHRDLKPSNLLVVEEDGVLRPKVIDFGVAKAIEDATLARDLTLDGQVVGTLEYMSPEQASGRLDQVDTRSDVYSLGVVLYQLLSGRHPYDLDGRSFTSAVRQIMESPPAPLGLPGVDSDLDVVIRKTLEKDPERRYPGALSLAEDIERVATGQPILARPPSARYQLRKMVSRNRVPFALLLGLVFVLVGSATVMTILYAQQQRARRAAEISATRSRTVNEFLRDMLSSIESRGTAATVAEVLDRAETNLATRFTEDPDVEAALRSTIGNAYVALREFDKGERNLGVALELEGVGGVDHEVQRAETLLGLARLQRARSLGPESLTAADSLARLALELEAEAEVEPWQIARVQGVLATIATDLRRYGTADSILAEALTHLPDEPGGDPRILEARAALLRGRSFPLVRMERMEEAGACLRESIGILRRLHPADHTETALCLLDLSRVVPEPAMAESLLREHLAMEQRLWGEDHANTLDALEALGVHYLYRFRFSEAEPLLRHAVSIAEARYPPGDEIRARTANDLGALLQRAGRDEEAIELYRSALGVWNEVLGPEHEFTCICRSNLARALSDTGRSEEAWELFQDGLAIARRVYGPDSGMAGLYLGRIAGHLDRVGRYPEAETVAREAVDIWGSDKGGIFNRALASENLGRALVGQGRWTEGERYLSRADSIYQEEGGLLPAGFSNRIELARCWARLERLDEAQRLLQEIEVRSRTELGPDHPISHEAHQALAEIERSS